MYYSSNTIGTKLQNYSILCWLYSYFSAHLLPAPSNLLSPVFPRHAPCLMNIVSWACPSFSLLHYVNGVYVFAFPPYIPSMWANHLNIINLKCPPLFAPLEVWRAPWCFSNKLMLAPGFSFTLPHLKFITRIVDHTTTNIHSSLTYYVLMSSLTPVRVSPSPFLTSHSSLEP